MSATDELLANNESYAELVLEGRPAAARPARKVAVLACMDARLDPARCSGWRRVTRT